MVRGKLQQPSAERIADEIAHLRDLDASTLRLRWREVTGKPAAPGLKGELLVKALAYAIQEKAFGGLSLAATKRLQAIAREGMASKDGSPREGRSSVPPRRLMPGTRLVREWQGVMHEVIVIPDGFLWQGATYPSLSTVAKAITGTTWNGWVFFGARSPPKRIKPVGSDQASPEPKKPTIDAGGSDAHA
ncbi:DUF2924 domain-containing protein [Phreatobacter sp. HK31-P]